MGLIVLKIFFFIFLFFAIYAVKKIIQNKILNGKKAKKDRDWAVCNYKNKILLKQEFKILLFL